MPYLPEKALTFQHRRCILPTMLMWIIKHARTHTSMEGSPLAGRQHPVYQIGVAESNFAGRSTEHGPRPAGGRSHPSAPSLLATARVPSDTATARRRGPHPAAIEFIRATARQSIEVPAAVGGRRAGNCQLSIVNHQCHNPSSEAGTGCQPPAFCQFAAGPQSRFLSLRTGPAVFRNALGLCGNRCRSRPGPRRAPAGPPRGQCRCSYLVTREMAAARGPLTTDHAL